MKKLEFLIISGEKKLTSFMRACDVFDPTKTYGEIRKINVTFKNEKDLCIERIKITIDSLKKSLEDSGHNVTLIHCLNKEFKVLPYIDRSVRVISTGYEWYMFDDFLRTYGLRVNTSEHRFIEEVSY